MWCGTPATCISVITPYKGQKTTIVRATRPFNELAQLVVSTIDRYQGDENDIVILSLVRSIPGNRFVALKNRYVYSRLVIVAVCFLFFTYAGVSLFSPPWEFSFSAFLRS